MREINGRFGTAWISSEPREWHDGPIEKILHVSLQVEPSNAGLPLHAGIRYVRMTGGPGIYVVLGATYSPNKSDTLAVEVAVLKVPHALSPVAREYEVNVNQEIAELILIEATNLLEHRSVLKAGTLRFDKMGIHPVDHPPKWWRYGTRVLIGLFSMTGYDGLSDEKFAIKLEEFAQDEP